MKRFLRDQWAQICAFTMVLTSALVLLAHVRTTKSDQAPAPSAQATPFLSGPGVGSSPGAAPRIGLSGPGVVKIITAKTPGRWIVDGSGASDSDTDDLNTALGNMKDGDVITVRPGVYKAALVASNKKLTIIGSDSDRSKTVLEASGRVLLVATGGVVVLKNLTLKNASRDYGHVIKAAESRIELSNVQIEASADKIGVALQNATLVGADCAFSGGRTGLDARDRAKVKLERCSFDSRSVPIRGEDQVDIELKSVAITGGLAGIAGRKATRLKMIECQLTGQSGRALALADPGSTAELTNVRFARSSYGLRIEGGAVASVKNSAFEDIRGAAIGARDNDTKITVSDTLIERSVTAIDAGQHAVIDAAGCTIKGGGPFGYGATADNSGKLILTRCAFVDSAGVAIHIGEDSVATLDQSTVVNGRRDAVRIGRDARLVSSDSSFTGNQNCGVNFADESATAVLRGVTINRNECAISLTKGGRVDSERGNYLQNKKGSYLYSAGSKSKVTLTGSGNKTD